MNTTPETVDHSGIEALYEEAAELPINTGGETIHAKRSPGFFRNLKWISMSVWLIFFLGPYLRWGGQQAILFDIPARQFHIFGITILPQDVWMLAMVMLFFALLLAAVTSVAGRVYCGYFCFQTVWTDIFTWIEEKLEGNPTQRRKLDKAPLTFHKLGIKLVKHSIWILIGLLTGISFTLWFGDAASLWKAYLTLQAPVMAWIAIAVFTAFTYLFAGWMREQVCFWLCPYARIQGMMYDPETILPTYDYQRGEPRGKLKKHQPEGAPPQGDCIDCRQCVAVCPTGIDIRHGQQEGCITCALCIDACDVVMDKINKPRGLIRYASLDEINGKPAIPLFRRPRVLVYLTIMLLAISGIIYGLSTIAGIELKVLHERQPLFVIRSDGTIQNKYELKILNKTETAMQVRLTASGHGQLTLVNNEGKLDVPQGEVAAYTVYLRIPSSGLESESLPVYFRVEDIDNPDYTAEYKSMFFAPE